MPSPLPSSSPAGEPSGRPALDELISQARLLRGGVDAVRREGAAGGEETPRGRWQRALCELTVAELDEVGGRLRELRAGATGPRADAPPTGSAEWNLLTDEVVWSAELSGIFGRSAADGPLSLDELPSWVLAEDQPALTAAVTDTLVDGSPLDVEFRIVRPDGSVRTLRMAGEPELDAEGDTACLWAVLRDVTELRLGEQAVRDSRESLTPEPDGARAWPAPATDGLAPEALQTASHYFPAEHSALVGGAWFDALALGGGETMLTVGELTGNGVAAVSGMAMLLGAVRGMALAGVAPGPLLDHLDELLTATAQPAMGGAVFARYDAGGGLLAWSHRGTCVPLLFRRGTGRRLQPPPDASVRERPDRPGVRLEPGDVLVLYTAGLTVVDGDEEPPAGRLPGLGPRLCAAATAQECLRIVVAECAGTRAQDAAVLVALVPG
jgi:PAS domain-containing protein